MLSLKPTPAVTFTCPHCGIVMHADGWTMPGMWMLGDFRCAQCGRRYYGTLPTGQALVLPSLLEAETGLNVSDDPVNWLGAKLQLAYQSRGSSTPLKVEVERLRPLSQPLLINCLDRIYGHALLRLLNTQHYLERGLDVWLIVPRWLRWMVPDGVAEIWTVDLPLRQGGQWNDDFAAQVDRRVADLDACDLGIMFANISEADFQMERFTRVKPFPIDDWRAPIDRPVITFIWRGDRLWTTLADRRIRLPVRRAVSDRLDRQFARLAARFEARRINALAARIRDAYPLADFAVTGLGTHDYFARDILDLRKPPAAVDAEVERQWCERYARSHIVIGVEGSNMLLPSSHAAAVIELLPQNRFGHIGTIPSTVRSFRDTLFRYRALPLDSPPKQVARMMFALLTRFPETLLSYSRPWTDHRYVETHYEELAQRFRDTGKGMRMHLR